jgi:hypothetical protein
LQTVIHSKINHLNSTIIELLVDGMMEPARSNHSLIHSFKIHAFKIQ